MGWRGCRGEVGVPPELDGVDDDGGAAREGLVVADAEPFGDRLDGGLVELRQDAVDGVEVLVGVDAPRKGGAHHAPHHLCDEVEVAGHAEREQHLGARAVPPGRDGRLAQHDPDLGAVLDVLGRAPRDLVAACGHGSVVGERVHDRLRPDAGPLLEHRADQRAKLGRRRLVGHLDDQSGMDGRLTGRRGVRGPLLVVQPDALHREPDQRRLRGVDPLGVAQDDLLFQEPRGAHVLDAHGVLLRRPTGLGHRAKEPPWCRGDAPHDGCRGPTGRTAADDLADDRLPVPAGRSGRCGAPVGLVDHDDEAVRALDDRVRDRLPQRIGTAVDP